MEDTSEYKRYWMKFHGRFFDKHEIKILLDEDRDFVFFYIAMLLESIAHKGRVRYNEKRPYTPARLSRLLNMPEEKVSASIEALKDADLLEVLEDGTIFLPKAAAMCGFSSDSTMRMRKFRANKRDNGVTCDVTSDAYVTPCDAHVTPCDGIYKSIEIRDKNNIDITPLIPPREGDDRNLTNIASKGSDEFNHVTRENVSMYFKRMRTNGGKNSSEEIEDDFWQYLVSVDFKKGDGMPISKSNMHTTFCRWIGNRIKEQRKESESADNERKAEEEERIRKHRADARMAYSLSHETDD